MAVKSCHGMNEFMSRDNVKVEMWFVKCKLALVV